MSAAAAAGLVIGASQTRVRGVAAAAVTTVRPAATVTRSRVVVAAGSSDAIQPLIFYTSTSAVVGYASTSTVVGYASSSGEAQTYTSSSDVL